MKNLKSKAYFDRRNFWLDFGNSPGQGEGELSFGTYSYEIDSFGNGSLTREETRQLYEAMKNYYKQKIKIESV